MSDELHDIFLSKIVLLHTNIRVERPFLHAILVNFIGYGYSISLLLDSLVHILVSLGMISLIDYSSLFAFLRLSVEYHSTSNSVLHGIVNLLRRVFLGLKLAGLCWRNSRDQTGRLPGTSLPEPFDPVLPYLSSAIAGDLFELFVQNGIKMGIGLP